jgi:putative oxidoreductase
LRFLDRLQPLGVLALRLVLGAIMIAHGYPKVFGGLQHTAAFVHSLGIPAWLGYVSAFVEFGGGILLVAGFLTRCAALAVFIDMLVAIFAVHFKHGFTGAGNYQLPLSLAAIAFALLLSGGGPISLDAVTGRR